MGNKKEYKIKRFYHFFSKIYDWVLKYWNRYVVKETEKDLDKFVRKNVKGGIDVLDLACGTGINVERLKKWKMKVDSYTGVDLSPDMQKKAKEKAMDLEKKEFFIEDIMKYEPKKKFDLITCTWALSHLEKPAELPKRYSKYLKKGGYMIFIFQGEVVNHYVLAKIMQLFAMIVQSKLVLEEEIQKFPKSIVLNKSYLGGYTRLIIIKKQ